MTKKKKLILLIVISVLVISIAAIVLFFVFRKPSIEGEWYNTKYIDLSNPNKPEESTDKMLFAMLKEPYKFTFEGTEMQIVYRYANIAEKETYYYRIDDNKLYYSKDHSSLNDKYYIITKRTKDEICLKGTKIDDDEIVLRK